MPKELDDRTSFTCHACTLFHTMNQPNRCLLKPSINLTNDCNSSTRRDLFMVASPVISLAIHESKRERDVCLVCHGR